MRVVARIGGMRTVHCVRAVFQGLAGVPGIERAEVFMGEATIDVTSAFRRADLIRVVEALGYTVVSIDEGRSPLPLA